MISKKPMLTIALKKASLLFQKKISQYLAVYWGVIQFVTFPSQNP